MRNDRPAPNATTAAAKNIAGRAPFATAVGDPLVRVEASMNDANVAMPSASPTWRTVVFAPLATPAFSGSMSERITLVSCELAKPTPSPNTIIPGSSARNETSRRDRERDQQQPDRLEREPGAHDARDAERAGSAGRRSAPRSR